MAVIDRQMVGERPDSDGKFYLPFRAVCEADNDGWKCSFDEVFHTRRAAEYALETHEHFRTYQQRRYNYLSLAEKIWLELDAVIDQIKELNGNEEVPLEKMSNLQGRASGLAFGVMTACIPYYESERAVAIEANRRWKMRQGQLEWAPTLGFKYSPPPLGRREAGITTGGVDEPVAVPRSRASNSPEAEAKKKLKPQDWASIKQGIGAGMFKAADLARVYGVSEACIEFVAKS